MGKSLITEYHDFGNTEDEGCSRQRAKLLKCLIVRFCTVICLCVWTGRHGQRLDPRVHPISSRLSRIKRRLKGQPLSDDGATRIDGDTGDALSVKPNPYVRWPLVKLEIVCPLALVSLFRGFGVQITRRETADVEIDRNFVEARGCLKFSCCG